MIEKVTGHLVRSSELKTLKNAEKVKRGQTDRPSDRRTKRGIESRDKKWKKWRKETESGEEESDILTD